MCKRTHLDIASVNSAIHISVENDTISEAHVSIGGVAAIPKYLHETSTFLTGKPLTSETILEASNHFKMKLLQLAMFVAQVIINVC